MSKPWMKFYPADWQADPALRSCSLMARGLWVEMLCLMQKSEPIGHLLVNGNAPKGQALATLCGASKAQVEKGLAELERAGVFSRTESGVIYSRRMVRDEHRVREAQENGAKGGNPRLKGIDNGGVNPLDKPGVGKGVKAQKPEAREGSVSNETGAVAPIDAEKKAWADAVQLLETAGRMSNAAARSFVGKLKADNGIEAKDLLPAIGQAIASGTQDPAAYLRKAAGGVSRRRGGGSPAPASDTAPVDWAWRLEQFRGPDRIWVESMWGPRPGQAGCQCPAELLEEQF